MEELVGGEAESSNGEEVDGFLVVSEAVKVDEVVSEVVGMGAGVRLEEESLKGVTVEDLLDRVLTLFVDAGDSEAGGTGGGAVVVGRSSLPSST